MYLGSILCKQVFVNVPEWARVSVFFPLLHCVAIVLEEDKFKMTAEGSKEFRIYSESSANDMFAHWYVSWQDLRAESINFFGWRKITFTLVLWLKKMFDCSGSIYWTTHHRLSSFESLHYFFYESTFFDELSKFWKGFWWFTPSMVGAVFSSQLHFIPSPILLVCIHSGCWQVAHFQHLLKFSASWMLLPESWVASTRISKMPTTQR